MPWEALCLSRNERYGPVTTDPYGEKGPVLSVVISTLDPWQI
jgi:hypothetical protein